MGPGGRAFLLTLVAFLVFGAVVASLWGGDEDAAQESTGGASGGSGEPASNATDATANATADANATGE